MEALNSLELPNWPDSMSESSLTPSSEIALSTVGSSLMSLIATVTVVVTTSPELSTTFISKSSEYWVKALTDADVPNSLVMGYKELSTDEQMWSNGYLQEISSINLGEMTVPGPPIRMSETPCRIQGSGPELGFNTEELLIELGYNWDEISSMRDNNVI